MSPNDILPGGGFRTALAWLLVLVIAAAVVDMAFLHWSHEYTPATDSRSTGLPSPSDAAASARQVLLTQISDMDWILETMTVDGNPIPLAEGVTTTLRFDENGHVAGHAGCNRYFSETFIDPDAHRIRFGPIGSTRRSCPPPHEQQERNFLTALEQVDRFELVKHSLTLMNASGTTSLSFQLDIPETLHISPHAASSGKAARARLIYRGTFERDGDHLVFTACGMSTAVDVEDRRGFILPLLESLPGAPGRGLYTEFHGTLRIEPSPTPPHGGTSPKPHSPSQTAPSLKLYVNDLLFVGTEGGSCASPPPVCTLLAGGNEPSWQLLIESSRSVFSRPGRRWELVGGMSPDDAFFSTRSGTTRLELNESTGEFSLSVQIERKPCRDTMADNWSAYTVHLADGENGFDGCARPGRFLPSAAGLYRYALTEGSRSAPQIELLLADNGRARLRQLHPSETSATVTEGLWQSTQPGGVELFLLRRNGKPALEHLVFAEEGTELRILHYDREIWEGGRFLRIGEVEGIDAGSRR